MDKDPIAEELGLDTVGVDSHLTKNYPSHDRHIRSGTLAVEYVTESKIYEEYSSFPVYYGQVLPVSMFFFCCCSYSLSMLM